MRDDRIVSEINEYEILQLLAGECRVLLGQYTGQPSGSTCFHFVPLPRCSPPMLLMSLKLWLLAVAVVKLWLSPEKCGCWPYRHLQLMVTTFIMVLHFFPQSLQECS